MAFKQYHWCYEKSKSQPTSGRCIRVCTIHSPNGCSKEKAKQSLLSQRSSRLFSVTRVCANTQKSMTKTENSTIASYNHLVTNIFVVIVCQQPEKHFFRIHGDVQRVGSFQANMYAQMRTGQLL